MADLKSAGVGSNPTLVVYSATGGRGELEILLLGGLTARHITVNENDVGSNPTLAAIFKKQQNAIRCGTLNPVGGRDRR